MPGYFSRCSLAGFHRTVRPRRLCHPLGVIIVAVLALIIWHKKRHRTIPAAQRVDSI